MSTPPPDPGLAFQAFIGMALGFMVLGALMVAFTGMLGAVGFIAFGGFLYWLGALLDYHDRGKRP